PRRAVIELEPAWSCRLDHAVSSWSSHVWLHGGHAVGQWYALARETGAVLWQRELEAADRIAGIAAGVIVATTAINGRPQLPGEGCHALELATGALLWSKPGRLGRRHAVAPIEVGDREVRCANGDLLDLGTGERVGRAEPRLDDQRFRWRRTEADDLFATMLLGRHRGPAVEVAPGCLLEYLYLPDEGQGHGLQGRNPAGEVTWRFALSSTGYQAGSSHQDHRLVSPYFYYLVGERPPSQPIDPEFPKFYEYVTSERHLLSVDARTGELVQDVALGTWNRCAIEDADRDGVLLSYDQTMLAYHRRL